MPDAKQWLDVSEAAKYLGVHFTTLRRWADAGDIPSIRTPGGRRRFHITELENFIQTSRQNNRRDMILHWGTKVINNSRQQIQDRNLQAESWMKNLATEQKNNLRLSGNRLMGLLMQYTSRLENGEPFLEEGKHIAKEYGQICHNAGLPISQSIQAFLFFQRSILGAVHETGVMSGISDQESTNIYQRASFFFDVLLIAMVDQYERLSP
jgi:excisionase family DNA binding protein